MTNIRLPLLLAFAVLPSLAACGPSEAEVRAAIEAANHCEQSSDCVAVHSKCPFDCYVPAHRQEAAELGSFIQSHQSTCTYSCIPQPPVACIQGKCVFER